MDQVIFNIGSSDTGSNSLSSILNAALNYDASKHLIINLTDAGPYNLLRRYNLKCNLTLNGSISSDGSKSEIHFYREAFSKTDTNTWGDGLLSIEGPVPGQVRRPVAVSISNVKFTLEQRIFNETNYFISVH